MYGSHQHNSHRFAAMYGSHQHNSLRCTQFALIRTIRFAAHNSHWFAQFASLRTIRFAAHNSHAPPIYKKWIPIAPVRSYPPRRASRNNISVSGKIDECEIFCGENLFESAGPRRSLKEEFAINCGRIGLHHTTTPTILTPSTFSPPPPIITLHQGRHIWNLLKFYFLKTFWIFFKIF